MGPRKKKHVLAFAMIACHLGTSLVSFGNITKKKGCGIVAIKDVVKNSLFNKSNCDSFSDMCVDIVL